MTPLIEFVANHKYSYLGDGAYVMFNGFALVLFTTDGVNVTNQVHLETNELREFSNFVEKVYKAI